MFPEPSSRGAASDLSALSHAQNERALDLLRRATEAHQRRAKAEQGHVPDAAQFASYKADAVQEMTAKTSGRILDELDYLRKVNLGDYSIVEAREADADGFGAGGARPSSARRATRTTSSQRRLGAFEEEDEDEETVRQRREVARTGRKRPMILQKLDQYRKSEDLQLDLRERISRASRKARKKRESLGVDENIIERNKSHAKGWSKDTMLATVALRAKARDDRMQSARGARTERMGELESYRLAVAARRDAAAAARHETARPVTVAAMSRSAPSGSGPGSLHLDLERVRDPVPPVPPSPRWRRTVSRAEARADRERLRAQSARGSGDRPSTAHPRLRARPAARVQQAEEPESRPESPASYEGDGDVIVMPALPPPRAAPAEDEDEGEGEDTAGAEGAAVPAEADGDAATDAQPDDRSGAAAP